MRFEDALKAMREGKKVKLNKIVFCKDFGFETEDGEDEDVIHLIKSLNNRDIEYKDIEVIEGKPDFSKHCDLLVLDWGGMGCIGNNLFGCFVRELLEEAENRPNQIFLIFSELTEWALYDIGKTIDDIPNNVFTDVSKLSEYFKELKQDD